MRKRTFFTLSSFLLLGAFVLVLLLADQARSTQQTVSSITASTTLNAVDDFDLTSSTSFPQSNNTFSDNHGFNNTWPPGGDWALTDVVIGLTRCLESDEYLYVQIKSSSSEVARLVLCPGTNTFTIHFTTRLMVDDFWTLKYHISSGSINSDVTLWVWVNGFEL